MLLFSSDTRVKLMHLFLLTNTAQRGFHYIRREYATAIHFPCLITLGLFLFKINQFWARSLHKKWSCSSRTLGDDMLAARCLMLNSYLMARYFSVHLTTNRRRHAVDHVVYGRNGLWSIYWIQMYTVNPSVNTNVLPVQLYCVKSENSIQC